MLKTVVIFALSSALRKPVQQSRSSSSSSSLPYNRASFRSRETVISVTHKTFNFHLYNWFTQKSAL
jgi:hypothetical protein